MDVKARSTSRQSPSRLPAVLSLGMVCQIGQIVLLRELLMVFHGNELSIGVILAVWMVGVGAGSRLGALAVERLARPGLLLLLTTGGVVVILPATVLLIRALRGWFDVLPGAYLSIPDMAVATLVVISPVCLLLGAQFVLLSQLWRSGTDPQDTSGAGRTYIGEAVGNVIGGVVFTFLLVHWLNAFQAAALAGLFMLAAALWLTRETGTGAGGRAWRLRAVLFGLGATVLAGSPLLRHVDGWAHRLQWRLFAPDHRLVEIRQSKYGTIAVAQREDQYSFFQSGHLLYATAGPDAETAALEEREAVVFAHFCLVQHENPRRVLLIGGGLRGTVREILRHPVEHVDYIELDPVLTEAARPYVPPATRAALGDARVRLIHADGRLFVKTTRQSYDMILVDVPDPATAVLNRYYTEEFFREAEARLRPGGVLSVSVVSTSGMRGQAVANRNATIYHTLARVFAHVLPLGERQLYLFATQAAGQVSADVETLRARYLARNIETEGFSHRHLDTLLEEASLRRMNWILRNHGRSSDAHRSPPQAGPLFPGSIAEQQAEEARLPPVSERYFINSDFRPIGYYHTLVFWNLLSRGSERGIVAWVLGVEPAWIAPAVGLALAATLLLRLVGRWTGRRPDTHLSVLFAVFTTGLSTMLMQIAVLFSFQSIYGFVYEMVGLIAAIFMGGLALGAALTHRFIHRKSDMRILACVQACIAGFAGLLALAAPWLAVPASPAAVFALFSAMTFSAGLLNGADFPLAAACCTALNKRSARATGIVYGVELAGASAGAVLASVVVAPVLGIAACYLLACVAQGTAFLVLLTARRSYV